MNQKKNNKKIILFIYIKNYYYNFIYLINKITNYSLEKRRFKKKLGYRPNLRNPKSFNEKIIWKKKNIINPLITLTSDKHLVRSYVKKKLGKKAKKILIPLIYVTKKPNSIPFNLLPDNFIIKANHSSGRNIIIKNGKFNRKEIEKKCKNWLKENYGLKKMELGYKNINRKIIIEKLITDEHGNIPKDFKFYVFNGVCKLIHVDFNRFKSQERSFYTNNWEYLNISLKYRKGPNIERPQKLEKMIQIVEKLSEEFSFARVDLYLLKNKIYFGEITHYPGSGTKQFNPKEFDFILGEYWELEK